MSIATVVLRGFGTSSYADITKLPTLGYSSGASVITMHGPAYFPRAQVYQRGAMAADVYQRGVVAAQGGNST